MKSCVRCKITKEDDKFHQIKENIDSLHTFCKQCINMNAKDRQDARKKEKETHKQYKIQKQKEQHKQTQKNKYEERKKNQDLLIVSYKVCSKCHIDKPAHSYHRHYDKKDCLKNECRDCINIRDRNNYAKNPESRLASRKRYCEKNPEKVKESQKKYQSTESFKLYIKNYMRYYRYKHKDAIYLYNSMVYWENPEASRLYSSMLYFKNRTVVFLQITSKYKIIKEDKL